MKNDTEYAKVLAWSWLGIVFIAMPIILAFVIGPQTLVLAGIIYGIVLTALAVEVLTRR